MTKLQKFGLAVSILSAVLWTIGLFVGWNYDLGGGVCDDSGCSLYRVTYHLIHYVLIALFAIGIGVILAEFSRKSLRKSCIMLIISVLLGWFSVSFAFWFLMTMCAGGCVETDIPGHIFSILGLMFIVLWFVALFFTIKYLTNSDKLSVLGVLAVAVFVASLFVVFISKDSFLLGGIKKALNITFLLFSIISITFCIIAGIKSYKEAKKSS